MSLEDRLFALVSQARQQNGDGLLRSPASLIPRLSSQAPDLHAEIKVLAHLLENDTAAKIAAAGDPAAEEARVSAEVAASQRVAMSAVAPAIAVARRVGPLSSGAAAPPAAGGWAGDSVAVGGPAYAPQPAAPQPGYTPPPAPQPQSSGFSSKPADLMKNKWVLGAAAVVVVLVGFQMMRPKSPEIPVQPIQVGGGGQPLPGPNGQPLPPPNGQPLPGPNGQPLPMPGPNGQPMPVPGPNGQPMPAPGPQPMPGPVAGGGGGQGDMPMLQPPNGQLPMLSKQQGQNGAPAFGFMLPIQGGAVGGIVQLPANGWQAGPASVMFARPGSSRPDSYGSGMLQLGQSSVGPARAMQPQWQQDNVGFGQICIAFIGQQGQQDVKLQGATMCVMDATCNRPSACGRVP